MSCIVAVQMHVLCFESARRVTGSRCKITIPAGSIFSGHVYISIPQIEHPLPHARDAGLPRDHKRNCAKKHDGYIQAHQARLNKSPLYITTVHLWQKLQSHSSTFQTLQLSMHSTRHAPKRHRPRAPTTARLHVRPERRPTCKHQQAAVTSDSCSHACLTCGARQYTR